MIIMFVGVLMDLGYRFFFVVYDLYYFLWILYFLNFFYMIVVLISNIFISRKIFKINLFGVCYLIIKFSI